MLGKCAPNWALMCLSQMKSCRGWFRVPKLWNEESVSVHLVYLWGFFLFVCVCFFFFLVVSLFFASGCISVGILHDPSLNHSLPKPLSIKKYHKYTNNPICTVRKEKKVLKGIVPCFNTVFSFFLFFFWIDKKKKMLWFYSLSLLP